MSVTTITTKINSYNHYKPLQTTTNHYKLKTSLLHIAMEAITEIISVTADYNYKINVYTQYIIIYYTAITTSSNYTSNCNGLLYDTVCIY